MYNVWLGIKPLLNKDGKPARFTYAMALHLKHLYKNAKMRPCTLTGKWADRLARYS